MPTSQPAGCLSVLLSLFGIRFPDVVPREADVPTEDDDEELDAEAEESWPYRLRDDFLSPAEFSFYRVLVDALGGRAVVCCKVNLGDLFYVTRPHENRGAKNRIDRKHVDFLLCDPVTMKPRCGLELDDRSHSQARRQERDGLVDGVFAAAGLPLERVSVRSSYSLNDLREAIEPHLAEIQLKLPAAVAQNGSRMCPKCGIAMVARVATKGARTGQRFFGCPNYPKCRETVELE